MAQPPDLDSQLMNAVAKNLHGDKAAEIKQNDGGKLPKGYKRCPVNGNACNMAGCCSCGCMIGMGFN